MSIKNNNPYNPINWMASNKVASNLLMILCLAGGLFVFTQTTQEVFPDFELDTVSISVPYPGASPEEVEKSVVLALEDAINEIDGIGEVSSVASEGGAHVRIEVIKSDERMRVAQDVKSAVDRISSFPDDTEDPVVTVDSRRREVMRLVLYGDASEITLREAADTVKDHLSQNSEIGPVDLVAAKNLEIKINISQYELRRLGLSLNDISNKLKQIAVEIPGGTLETKSGDLLLRLSERRENAQDFANIPIAVAANGSQLLLKDIATIEFGLEDSNKQTLFNGKQAIAIEVYRIGDQTPVGVSDAVKGEIPKLNSALPGNLTLEIRNDRSRIFKQRADLLLKNGYWGLGLVILFLALFLELRIAFWVSMGIPISFAGAFLIFPATDFSINVVSMFAFIISLGIVVDDAIVVGENIYSYREKGYSALDAAITGSREVAWPIIFSVLTNIVAFIPLYFIPGILGKIFQVIPLVVICVFSISLIECLLILPSHLRLKSLVKKHDHGLLATLIRFQTWFNKRFENFVESHYKGFLTGVINNRYGVVIIAVSILIMAYAYAFSGRMGMVPFPRVESDYAYSKVTLPLGSPEDDIQKIQQQILDGAQRLIAKYPKDGLSTGIYSVIDENSIEARMYLLPAEERLISTTETTKLWRKQTGKLLGVETSSFVSNRGGPGSGSSLTVELSHRDNATLTAAGEALAQKLAEFPNANDIDDGTANGKRQFDFKVSQYGYALGLNAQSIASQIRASFYGLEAFKQQQGINEVTIRLRLPEGERESEHDLNNLIIKTASGQEVLLKDVVTITEGRAYTQIKRRNGRRTIQVQADIEPPSQTNRIVEAIMADTLPELQQRYQGLSYSFEGRQAEIRDSIQSLIYGLITVLLVIYALIAILFGSYTQPLMVMIAIPFSAIGAVIGHLVMGYSLSLMSLFGLLALTGVVVNDSIVLIEFANRSRHKDTELLESLLIASVRRFRPIILTTMTTFVGLAPMIFETSRQARFLIPMALSLGFGILFATMITLILIPALYMIIEDIKGLFVGGERQEVVGE